MIKSRATLRAVGALLNIDMPRDGHKFSSPFRPDKSPSCTVKGDVFTDWSTGEHLDQIDFFAAAKGIPGPEAIRNLARIFQIVGDLPARLPAPPRQADADERETRSRKRAAWPTFEIPSRGEILQIAELRGLSPEAIGLAVSRGLLWACNSREGRAWVVGDSSHRNAQARRLDGRAWEKIGAKAWTMPGSEASWPIGLREAASFPAIALCEGGPDMLAALHLSWIGDAEDKVAAVAMLGAANRLPADALPLFAGRRVRIFGHMDAAGQNAAARWAGQLAGEGCDVDGYKFDRFLKADGQPVNDLNDFCHIDSDQWLSESERIESAFNFETSSTPSTTNPNP
jgi:hypothetical protein